MGTHYQGNPREMLALDSYIKLVRAAETVIARIHRAPGMNLTVSQFGVLEALLHLGPLNQTQLAGKLLKSGGNITMVLSNLEKQGLVERIRNKEDRRFITVHLTTKGKKLIEELFPRHVENVRNQMEKMSDSELKQLGALCRKLGVEGH